MKIKCSNCHKEWDYGGDNTYFATCPNCRRLVKLNAKAEKEVNENDSPSS